MPYGLSNHLDCHCQKEERKVSLCVRAVNHVTLHSAALLRSLLLRLRWVPLPSALEAQCEQHEISPMAFWLEGNHSGIRSC